MLDHQRQRLADHVERVGSVEGLVAVRDAQVGEAAAESLAHRAVKRLVGGDQREPLP